MYGEICMPSLKPFKTVATLAFRKLVVIVNNMPAFTVSVSFLI